MNFLQYFLLFYYVLSVNCVVFDRFSGKDLDYMDKQFNGSDPCIIKIKPCTAHDVSRVDGSCNSHKVPLRGTARGPYSRLLPPDYSINNELRKNKHNLPLPSARKVRTTLRSTGRVARSHFTIAAIHMLEFIQRDISLLDGPKDYLGSRSYCCTEAGMSDPRCIPIVVHADDPYLKVTDVRCLNFSRAASFQDFGCTPKTTAREQINYQTPTLDLSTIYGVDDDALSKVRKFSDGLLILEKREDRYVPLNITNEPNNIREDDTKINIIEEDKNKTEDYKFTGNIPEEKKVTKRQHKKICIQNKGNETLCYQFGFPEAGNYGLRTTSLGIFFMREHNRLASALQKINPCWKDDRLFKVARQINIATAANIYLYELLPSFMGYKNMAVYELVSDQSRFVTKYEVEEPPLVYAEFEVAMRFFNTLLDGRVKLYTESHHYAGEFSHSETLFRQALLEQDKNFEGINRGTFYQSSGKVDDIQDPEVSDNYYGNLQKVHDIGSIDIQRGRDMGIRSYNAYRELCGMKEAKVFEDLQDIMDAEKMEALKLLYEDVDDIDLLAGIMSEDFVQESVIGPTLFCIMAKQLQVFKTSDRFWFERGDQLHSFTPDQLREVRKTNIARLACDNAEGLKYIQPHAFSVVKPGNELLPCDHILGANLMKWQDDSCSTFKFSQDTTKFPTSYIDQGMPSNFTTFFDELLTYKPHQWFPRTN